VILARSFSASITHVASVTKQIGLPRIATIVHAASMQKAVALTKLATITHAASVQKAIVLGAKIATITHAAIFTRAVTLRRSFIATTTHVAKAYVYIETRLLVAGGGVINYIRSLFVFGN
jgi:hypothetical protein